MLDNMRLGLASMADGDLDEAELARHFARVGQAIPSNIMVEDKDRDGKITFDESGRPRNPVSDPKP